MNFDIFIHVFIASNNNKYQLLCYISATILSINCLINPEQEENTHINRLTLSTAIANRFESKVFSKTFGSSKAKVLNMIAKIRQGYLCMREIDLSFNQLHYSGALNSKYKYINNISDGALILGRVVPSEINSSSTEVSIQ